MPQACLVSQFRGDGGEGQIWADYGQQWSPGQENPGTFKAPASGSRCLTAPRRCLLAKGGEDPTPVLPGATASSSVKDNNRRLFDFPASPSTGCACLHTCLPACLPAPELLEREGGIGGPLLLSLEILIRYSVKLAPNQGSSYLNLEMEVESWNRFEPVHDE